MYTNLDCAIAITNKILIDLMHSTEEHPLPK